jgi:glycosyltransferase involved in cell wall biosynthesis
MSLYSIGRSESHLAGLSIHLAIVALVMAMFPRVLTAIGAPAVLNFLHFPVTLGAVCLVTARIRNPNTMRILSGLYCLLILMLWSAFTNDAGIVNAAMHFALLAEPFLLLVLLTHEPWAPSRIRLLRRTVLGIASIHAGMAYFQFLVLGLGGDDVKGMFLAQGAGHHVAGAVALSAAAYLMFALPAVPRAVRVTLCSALAAIVVMSDSKQVIAVFLASLAVLSLVQARAARVLRFLSFTAVACGGLLIAAQTFFPALKSWSSPEYIQAGLRQKASVLPLLISHFESPLNWLLGMGPGHTGGRLGELIPVYHAYLEPLGVTTSPITAEIRRVRDANWLSSVQTGSSMWSPFFSWGSVFGDLGLLGVGALVALWLLVWRSCVRDQLSRFFVLNVLFFGATFSWFEEPGYMMFLAALVALLRQQGIGGVPSAAQPRLQPSPAIAAPDNVRSITSASDLMRICGSRQSSTELLVPEKRSVERRSRLRVLVSAYSCEPGRGSEPGVGWNMARALSAHHDVWVMTRTSSRASIERRSERQPIRGLRFIYFDLPPWLGWLQEGDLRVQVHYYLWQFGAYRVARRLHRKVGFDLVHHITFAKFWSPSFMSLLPLPFVWGPVGGGESAPRTFWADFGVRGFLYEALREAVRSIAQLDPFVRMTATRSTIALATTEETRRYLDRLHASDPLLMLATGISCTDLEKLVPRTPRGDRPVRFLSVGRLLHLKGFHLALRAFARLNGIDAEYWIIGDGPEASRLRRLVADLGLTHRVRFLGALPRDAVLGHITDSDVLVHPSLHESGGIACLEAMAAAKPVICLDLGGPAAQVTPEVGVKIPASAPAAVVRELARAMRALALDPALRQRLGTSGRRRIMEEFVWEKKANKIASLYRGMLHRRTPRAGEDLAGSVATSTTRLRELS